MALSRLGISVLALWACSAGAATLNFLEQASAYTQAGMYQSAVESLKKYDPQSNLDTARLNVAIGRIYLEMGEPRKAIHYFEEADAISPNEFQTKLSIADAKIRLGDIRASKAALKSIREDSDGRMEVQYRLSQIDELSGNTVAAETRMKQLVARYPTKDAPVVYRAKMILGRGDLEGAISYLKESGKKFSGSAAILEALGDALLANGKTDQAIEAEKNAQKIYLKQGRLQQAMAVQLKLSRMSKDEIGKSGVGAAGDKSGIGQLGNQSGSQLDDERKPMVDETAPALLSRRGVTNKNVKQLPEYARPNITAFYDMFPFPAGTQITGGSGVVIDGGKKVVTNRHVIEQGKDIAVRNGLGDVSRARVVFKSETDDLAVLELDSPFPKDRAMKSDSFRRAKPGSSTVVMGYPLWYVLGSSTPSLTNGVVAKATGINEDPTTFQLTAKINKGNSGGPVLDMYGNLVGITMGKLDNEEIRKSDGLAPEDINFAIHIDRLKKPLNMQLVSIGEERVGPMRKPEDIYQMMVGKVVIVAVTLN